MKKRIAMLCAVLIALPLFAQSTDEHAKTKKGAIVGSIAGAVAGAVIDNNRGDHDAARGAVVGALAGGAVGAIVGAMMDRQERELREIHGADVTRTSSGELKVCLKDEVLFNFDSSALRPTSRESLRRMANVFRKYPDTRLRVEGFTDSTGSADYNLVLSEHRADSVADFLRDLGVGGSRIHAVGYGKRHPRASNATDWGRQLNRRVEIHILANPA